MIGTKIKTLPRHTVRFSVTEQPLPLAIFSRRSQIPPATLPFQLWFRRELTSEKKIFYNKLKTSIVLTFLFGTFIHEHPNANRKLGQPSFSFPRLPCRCVFSPRYGALVHVKARCHAPATLSQVVVASDSPFALSTKGAST